MCGVRTAYNSISTNIDTQNMRDGRGRHRERERGRVGHMDIDSASSNTEV